MREPIKVVLLPTEDTTFIWKTLMGSVGLSRYESGNPMKPHIKLGINQHIYITISQGVEPIKEGDWLTNGTTLLRVDTTQIEISIYQGSILWRKIIATTDTKLHILIGDKLVCEDTNTYEPIYEQVPQVQQSFLKEFVANPDGEWEVEYELKYKMENELNMGEDPFTSKPKTLLKLNQDNTVNITAVEEKMIPLNKVKELCRAAFMRKDVNKGLPFDYTDDSVEDWVKENLN